MKFYAINGSKRDDGNTSQLLKKALEGVKKVIPDAEVEYINLYEVPFNGCKSCFACKKLNGKHYGKCVYKDDFKPILEKIVQADGLIFGSPVYFGDVTGNMRCLLERLCFPFLVYDKETDSLAPKRMPTAFIYTMNVNEELADAMGYNHFIDNNTMVFEMTFTKPYNLCSYDTYQFSDYSKYKSDLFDEKHKAEVRETQFPKDMEQAFEIGSKIARDAIKE
ncbi:MAG: flavodoxin family protein [Methanobrevibacter sp.]|uniref:flavodoxin family protein n=1 Tax=Methanobrevibacter sp. TaxID=66852 RepID=UPI0026E0BB65|nr:flavodoxin family protein [Methanobrevibacter sp.]MDO5848237.1 flavodoxin family protein [Methanobrevibacter sp.]